MYLPQGVQWTSAFGNIETHHVACGFFPDSSCFKNAGCESVDTVVIIPLNILYDYLHIPTRTAILLRDLETIL